MANTLKIIKKSTKVFWHVHNDLNTQKFAISDFEISLDGNNFKIVEVDGAKRYNYLVQDITIVDETGTSAVETFTNAEDFYNRLISLQYTPFYNPLADSPTNNKFISQAGFTLTGTNLTVNANWIWKLLGITYSNPANVIIPIPYCAAGKSRIEYVVPNPANGFTRYPGPESATILVAPEIPNDNMYVTYYIVTDSTIGDLSSPIVGDAYIPKAENESISSLQSGVINFIILETIQNKILLSGGATELRSINHWTNPFLFSGRDLYIKNDGTENCLIKHLYSGAGNYTFSFPNEVDFVHKPKELLHFKLRFTTTGHGIYEYVGTITIKIYPIGELQIFKVPGNTNNEILEAGDYCIGFVEGQFINANYISGDRTLLASFDI